MAIIEIAQLTVRMEKLILKAHIKDEIFESKKKHKDKSLDAASKMWIDGYINGLRMTLCLLEELDEGQDGVSS